MNDLTDESVDPSKFIKDIDIVLKMEQIKDKLVKCLENHSGKYEVIFINPEPSELQASYCFCLDVVKDGELMFCVLPCSAEENTPTVSVSSARGTVADAELHQIAIDPFVENYWWTSVDDITIDVMTVPVLKDFKYIKEAMSVALVIQEISFYCKLYCNNVDGLPNTEDSNDPYQLILFPGNHAFSETTRDIQSICDKVNELYKIPRGNRLKVYVLNFSTVRVYCGNNLQSYIDCYDEDLMVHCPGKIDSDSLVNQILDHTNLLTVIQLLKKAFPEGVRPF